MADKSFADYVKDLMGVLPTVNGNPMLSVTSMTDENARYREDPFYKSRDAQERKRLAEEEAKKAAQSGSGLFGAMPSGGGDGVGGRNYYVEREAQLRAANLPEDKVQSILRAEQEANNARINSALTLFGNAVMPGATILGLSKYGPEGYMDYLQGNTRVMMGDTSGYQSPFTPKAAGIAAPVVSGRGGTTRSADAIQEAIARAQAMANPAPVVNMNTRSADAIQEAIARAQAMSSIENGMEAARIAAEQSYGVTPTFSNSSDGYSAQGNGSGGYSAPTMSDPYGGYI